MNRAIQIAGLVPTTMTTNGSAQPHDSVRKAATVACTAAARSAPADCKIATALTACCTSVSAPTALDT